MLHWGPQAPDHGLVPVRNWAEQQKVRGGQAGETSCLFTATPHLSHFLLSSAPCQITGSIRFSWYCRSYCELHIRPIQVECFLRESSWNHPLSIPAPWKHCLPQNQSLVPKRLKTAVLYGMYIYIYGECVYIHGCICIHLHAYVYMCMYVCGASPVTQWERICLQFRRHEFHPGVGKIPWRRAWQPTPVFSLAWRSPWTEEPGRL